MFNSLEAGGDKASTGADYFRQLSDQT